VSTGTALLTMSGLSPSFENADAALARPAADSGKRGLRAIWEPDATLTPGVYVTERQEFNLAPPSFPLMLATAVSEMP